MPTSAHDPAGACDDRRLAGRFFAASLVLKLVLLMLDVQPRFFLGDSESYLTTLAAGYIPRDRSWLYGFLAVEVASATHDLRGLVLLQSLVGAAVSAGVGFFAIRGLGLSRRVAWLLVVGTSLEPFALYYERSVMTESLGQASFLASTMALVGLVRRPTIARAAILAATTVFAVALRTAFVPHACLVVAVAAVLALWPGVAPLGRGACLAAALLVLVGLRGYAEISGRLVDAEPALNPRSGAFLVGLVAPVLVPADFDGLGVREPAALLAASRAGWPWRRNAQTFDDDGIFARVEHEVGDWRLANRITKDAASRAVRRDPVGILRIAAGTAREYLDERLYHRLFRVDAGLARPLPAAMVKRITRVTRKPFDPAPALAPSLCSRWLKLHLWAGRVIFAAAWVLPFVLWPLASRLGREAAVGARLLGLVSVAYVASIVLFALVMTPRFLMPLVPCVALMTAALVTVARRRVDA